MRHNWNANVPRASFAYWKPSVARDDMCELCGQKPKYIESNGRRHPYCSRTCAANRRNGVNPIACILQGCRATGRMAFSGFCSEIHAGDAVRSGQVEGCNQCRAQPKTTGDLCFTCDRRSRALRPRLEELDNDGTAYKSIKEQFSCDWQSPTGSVQVKKIYEIIVSHDVRAKQNAYRKKGGPGMREIHSYHSSQCICDLGVKEAVLCDIPACGICSIVKSSFNAFAFGIKRNTGRFGDGIYSYLNPALADKFATSCTSSPYRVIIVCDAILGPGSSSPTNKEESLFLPTADAIVPRFLIMYSK